MKLDTIDCLDKGYVRLVDQLGSDLSVANAARVSFDKETNLELKAGALNKLKRLFNKAEYVLPARDARLLKFLAEHGHTSPFRHAALTFEIYAPLMVARQWWKYAVASTHLDDQNGWNESSRRYVTEATEFYIPAENAWRSAPANKKQGSGEPLSATKGRIFTDLLAAHIAQGEELYTAALEEGVATEQARLFLPAYGMYVRWRWTVSLAGLLHFLDQRLEHDAQQEIQEYAKAVAELTRTAFPASMEAWL